MSDTSELLKSGAGDKIADLLHKLSGPSFEEFGILFGDTVRVWRLQNAIKMLGKTQRLLLKAGLSPQAVPPRLFLPLLEASSMEDNESLQDMWAGLLATSSQRTDSVSPSFVETLKQLTPDEARFLEGLYDDVKSEFTEGGGTPFSPSRFVPNHPGEPAIPSDTFERLGLIRRDYHVQLRAPHASNTFEPTVQDALDAIAITEADIQYRFLLTRYATAFLEACRGPKPRPRQTP